MYTVSNCVCKRCAVHVRQILDALLTVFKTRETPLSPTNRTTLLCNMQWCGWPLPLKTFPSLCFMTPDLVVYTSKIVSITGNGQPGPRPLEKGRVCSDPYKDTPPLGSPCRIWSLLVKRYEQKTGPLASRLSRSFIVVGTDTESLSDYVCGCFLLLDSHSYVFVSPRVILPLHYHTI